MTFDTNDTGKYCFDQRQELTNEELSRLEDEYYARVRNNMGLLYKNMTYTNAADKANQTVSYIIVGIAIIVPLISWFLLFREMSGYAKVFLTVGIPLIGIGIMLFVKLYLRISVKKRIYSETIDAECIGYARYFESGGGDSSSVSGIPCVSPVFTYRYEGTMYTACYDGFDTVRDCPIALGPNKIRISPDHPEAINNHGDQRKDEVTLFAIVFFCCRYRSYDSRDHVMTHMD